VADRINLTFGHDYRVAEVGLPISNEKRLDVHYFPGSTGKHRGDWRLAVEIGPAGGAAWIGVFGGGYNSKVAFEGIMSTPDPSRILVIAQGQPFLVSANRPTCVDHLKCYPVTQVLIVPAQGIIALADFTGLACIGKNGLMWANNDLASDDVQILGSENGVVRVRGFVAPRNADVEFDVDSRTGRIVG
jgi:hypothetical protein